VSPTCQFSELPLHTWGQELFKRSRIAEPCLSPIPSCPTIHLQWSLTRSMLNQRAHNLSSGQQEIQGTLIMHKLSNIDCSPSIIAYQRFLRRWLSNSRSHSLRRWSKLFQCPSPPTPGARHNWCHTYDNPTTPQGLYPCTPNNRTKLDIRHIVTHMAHPPPPNTSRVRPGGHTSLFRTGHQVPAAIITTIAMGVIVPLTVDTAPTVTPNTTTTIGAIELHLFRSIWFSCPRRRCLTRPKLATSQYIFRLCAYHRKLPTCTPSRQYAHGRVPYQFTFVLAQKLITVPGWRAGCAARPGTDSEGTVMSYEDRRWPDQPINMLDLTVRYTR